MSNKGYYTDYSEFLSRKFPGLKVQKISIDAGFSCPNRDGTISTGGCIYCNVNSFSPGYCNSARTISDQIAEGRRFFARKYPMMKYLAYFQSFTNTHAPLSRLRTLYDEAISHEDVVGLIIGTRPDCMPQDVLEYLAELNLRKPVIVEYGAESSHDATLRLINRGHTWAHVVDAVNRTASMGISCGLHLIAYLPGESAADVLTTVERACRLPIDTLKMHQLQIIRGTRLHSMVEAEEICIYTPTVEDYLDLCVSIVGIVPRHIALERFVSQSPPGMLVSPSWGLKNYEFTNLLRNRLEASRCHDVSL